jgi:hypothetical protein
MVLSKYNSLQSLDTSSNEYFKLRAWLDKLISVPFGMYKDIPVRLDDGPEKCSEFMRNARKWLDRATYGQEDPKLQIMQFISTKIANPAGKGLSLLLIGPPGIGKTTIIKNGIANALGWPFQFISLGGDSDASTYTGHQLVYESSHCGKIVNSLVASKSMSAVLMFDEVDKTIDFHEFCFTSFKLGLNKAMELNKDKMFTLEQMQKAFEFGKQVEREDCNDNFQEYLRSIKQPTEIEVEIVVETASLNPHDLICEEIVERPKLDSEGCLILTKLINP